MSEPEIQIQIAHPEVFNFFNADDAEIKLDEHVDWIRHNHPRIAHIIADLADLSPSELSAKIRDLQACSEFSESGRGLQWATTVEQHLRVRRTGATTLLASLLDGLLHYPKARAEGYYLLDVFGGAGFIALFARDVFSFKGTVLTSDPSAVMVRMALQKGLPAFWQRAQDLFMTRTNSVDAVLFAYGTHHVPVQERLQSFEEAWRVLRPGGVLIFHDFEENTPAARWFEKVVDRYTITGHKHAHFTQGDVRNYFTDAGFDVELITTIDDSFQFTASTRKAAHRAATEFMGGAYGLERLNRPKGARRFLWNQIKEIFSVEEMAFNSNGRGVFKTVIHRPALLGIGRKPEHTISVYSRPF